MSNENPPYNPEAVGAYARGSCPICAKWKEQDKLDRTIEYQGKKLPNPDWRPLCRHCDKPIPEYEQGRVRAGFDSTSIDHYHFKDVAGVAGKTVVKARLCFECHVKDWLWVYKDLGLGYGEGGE